MIGGGGGGGGGVGGLLLMQFVALLKKNVLVSWRNKKASVIQLFSSIIFLLLILCIKEAIDTTSNDITQGKTIRDPVPLTSPAIPPCEDKFFIKDGCFDFVYSGNSSSRIQQIVSSIMANNPGRPIPTSKVLSFITKEDVDTWLYDHPQMCPGALHFTDVNSTFISYGIQTNSTSVSKRGKYEDPTFKFQIPLQIAAEREIAKSLLQDSTFSWVVAFKEFAHPSTDQFDPLSAIYPTFFLAMTMFNFVLQISSLVTEKELKLRQAMSMMGLYDSAYWFSWFTWETIIALLSSLFTVLFGMMYQFDLFKKNSFIVVYLVFFLFQLNMTSFAFMLSAFVSKSTSSTTIGFFMFIVGFVTQLITVTGAIYNDSISKPVQYVWSIFSPNLFSQALALLTNASASAEDDGISWSGRSKCAPNDTECQITINDIYKWLLSTFVVWFVLAIYFDNIVPNASGVRKSCFYFLLPGYWIGRSGTKVKEGGICSCMGSLPPVEMLVPDDEDVLEEENIVKQQTKEGINASNVAVQIRGLTKTYAGTRKFSCCCKCKKTSPYHALKGLWVNFSKDQLFCLLGPNGAGKTTAINCLTGITPVTGGDALIYGHSIRSSTGMANIRKIIGVCPQFDILWEALSGEEHLHLFASIKGLPPSSIKSVAEKSLAQVKLTPAAKMRAGSYSGGMKRRLSVAISLIGDPKLIIMDEPTTGMDPITRRHVWDIIEEAKKGRAIVLTTHSMEEADVLSDRIGIMAKGRLRCIGTSIRLKSRFGTGFIANVSFAGVNNGQSPAPDNEVVTTDHHDAVKRFFKNVVGYLTWRKFWQRLGVVAKEESKNFLTFVIPHEKEGLLTNFFEELQSREREFGISDIQLSLTTMEEVFLNIARQAELETAAAERRMATLTLTTTGASVEIPVGARFVGIPGSETEGNPKGIMVEVFWVQDDTGTLCISGHSPEMPVPPRVQISSSDSPSSRRNSLGQRGPVQGIVIDPEQVGATNSF
ncbi:hypothetical protein ACFE04_024931 [Oxalis oulophora]